MALLRLLDCGLGDKGRRGQAGVYRSVCVYEREHVYVSVCVLVCVCVLGGGGMGWGGPRGWRTIGRAADQRSGEIELEIFHGWLA